MLCNHNACERTFEAFHALLRANGWAVEALHSASESWMPQIVAVPAEMPVDVPATDTKAVAVANVGVSADVGAGADVSTSKKDAGDKDGIKANGDANGVGGSGGEEGKAKTKRKEKDSKCVIM